MKNIFFGKKKKTMPEISFDPKMQKAVLKCSMLSACKERVADKQEKEGVIKGIRQDIALLENELKRIK